MFAMKRLLFNATVCLQQSDLYDFSSSSRKMTSSDAESFEYSRAIQHFTPRLADNEPATRSAEKREGL